MKSVLFSIGSFHIYGYGLMIAIGVLAAFFVAERRALRLGLDAGVILDLTLWCAVGGFLGAKLLYYFTIADKILADPSILLRSLSDGFVVYGGIIAGILSGYLFCRRKQLPFWKYFDLVMPSIALAQGFGRIGCFLAGCCYGRETSSFLGVIFPEGGLAPSGVPLLPTQLFSSAFDFLHCLLLLLFAAGAKHRDGEVACLYLICYSLGRFGIEFLRGDELRGSVGLLSTSQFIALFLFAAGLVGFVLIHRKKDSG